MKQEDDFYTMSYFFKKPGEHETPQVCSVSKPISLNK